MSYTHNHTYNVEIKSAKPIHFPLCIPFVPIFNTPLLAFLLEFFPVYHFSTTLICCSKLFLYSSYFTLSKTLSHNLVAIGAQDEQNWQWGKLVYLLCGL